MNIIIFEDNKFDKLYPLTYLRPVFELKCGHVSLRQRIEKALGEHNYFYFVRDYLSKVFGQKLGQDKVNQTNALKEDILLVNGRLLTLSFDLSVDGPEEIGTKDGDIVYARIKKTTVEKMNAENPNDLLEKVKGQLDEKNVDATLIHYPWNLVQKNGEAITEDFNQLAKKGILGAFSNQAAIVGDKDLIYTAEGSDVRPFVTLDTTNGPIILEDGVIVHPMTHIEGPCSIDKNTHLFGGNIREGTSIGPVCRIHGEIEESIIHGYSNKHHDGFLGHAYLGEWVNLGAFTTNSDLKNDYTSVKLIVNGEQVDSEDMKVGSFIGDHTKTGIGTTIITGAMIGVMSNVVGSGTLIPKVVPSFCWYLNDKVTKGFGRTHMIDTAKKSMGRRKVELTADEEEMIKKVFDLTREERQYWIKKSFS